MKLKNNYTLTSLAGEYVAVPLDGDSNFKGIVKLNETGADVFRGMQEGLDDAQIAQNLIDKYGIDSQTAQKAVQTVADKLSAAGLTGEPEPEAEIQKRRFNLFGRK